MKGLIKANMNNEINVKKIKNKSLIAFLSVILVLGLGINLVLKNFSPEEKLISTTESENGKYTIEAYLIEGGLTVDDTVKCYLKTENKFGEKMIYNDYHIDYADINWIDDSTVNINGHVLNLPNDKYDFRDE